MPTCIFPLYHFNVHFPHHTVPMGTSQIQSCNSSKHNIYLLLIGRSLNANLSSIPGVRVDISSCKIVQPTSPKFYGVSSPHPGFRMLVICSLNNFNLVCHYLTFLMYCADFIIETSRTV